ncbi:hypothetical protein [Pseudomonas syringae]|uniref:hypothetical protein n=1 Tax=Pseudomonas syringae TaxID=317 RepID=UPI000464417D|nr:hypothetical protein [Pseudomonas syringae]
MDSADDFIARHDEAVTRTGAFVNTGVNTFIGGSSSLGIAATLLGCVSVIGCLVPAGLGGIATLSFNSAADSAGVIAGPYVSTEGERVLSSLHPENNTPDNSALTALGRNAAESVAEAIILRGTGKLLLRAYGEGAKATSIEFLPKATRNSAGQIETNITQGSAIKTLESNGYKKTVSQDGSVTVLTNGEKTYRFYPSSTSTGQPSASLTIDGLKKPTAKIRFSGEYSWLF